RRVHGREMSLKDRPEAFRAGREHALLAALFCENSARAVEKPEPEARRSPVHGCDDRLAHRWPPSTMRVCAVSMRAASEARKRQTPTMSAGCITSRMHCFATWADRLSSVTQSFCWRSVMTQPGATAL